MPEYLTQLPLDPYAGQPFQYEPAGLELPLDQSREEVAFRQSIQAHTPLFWSVGPGNARLKQMQTTRFQAADENNPEGEARLAAEPVCAFISEDSPWSGSEAFAFPLPK